MELPIGIVLIAAALFYVSIKLWMVNHAARLSERNGAVTIWDGAIIPAAILVTGVYCIDEARRRAHWMPIKAYVVLTFLVMGALYLMFLGARLLGHRRRCGRWTLGRSGGSRAK
jgi:hypothetical protein